MSHPEESTGSATFRRQSIDGDAFGIQPTRMIDVITTSTQRSLIHNIHQINDQWRMNRNHRMQTAWRLPRSIANAADIFALSSRRLQRNFDPVDGDAMPL
jgi:hypothetical protein